MVTDVVRERPLVNGLVCTPSMRLNHMRVCKLCFRNHTLQRNTTRGNKKSTCRYDRAQSFFFLLRTGMNYVTNTFLLPSSSARSKQLLCFVHHQGADYIGPRSTPLLISPCKTNKTNNKKLMRVFNLTAKLRK